MSEASERALEWAILKEGPQSNRRNDPGGRTRFGICERDHSALWSKPGGPTREDAHRVYHHIWEQVHGDELPWRVAMILFENALNQALKQAVLNLQRFTCQLEDGSLGPKTLRAAQSAGNLLVPFLLYERARDYIALAARRPDDLLENLGGWMRRLGELGEIVLKDLHLWGG